MKSLDVPKWKGRKTKKIGFVWKKGSKETIEIITKWRA
jgi:hypothetical protein